LALAMAKDDCALCYVPVREPKGKLLRPQTATLLLRETLALLKPPA